MADPLQVHANRVVVGRECAVCSVFEKKDLMFVEGIENDLSLTLMYQPTEPSLTLRHLLNSV